MTVITRTKADVALVHPMPAEIFTYVAAAPIEAGQLVYVNAAGKVDLASAAVVGTAKSRGIALETVGLGQPVSILKKGTISGWDLSGLAFDAVVYVSNTAGELDTVAGTVSVIAARVMPFADAKTIGKILYVTDWA